MHVYVISTSVCVSVTSAALPKYSNSSLRSSSRFARRSLALDFCVSFQLVKNPPPVENGIPVVSNIAAFEAENRHVKTVKNHILKFVDVETSKKKTGKGGNKPAGKSVVGKRGCMKQLEEYERWQKKAAMGTAKKIPEAQASEAPVDPFSVSPRIPENKRMAR